MGVGTLKYMGHKGKMLPLLSEIIVHESKHSEMIADPFCGSGVVSWHLSEHFNKKVVAGDLQSYAAIRAASVITRTTRIERCSDFIENWFKEAESLANEIFDFFPNHIRSIDPELKDKKEIESLVIRSRNFVQEVLPSVFRKIGGRWAVSKAYGGYYYSPYQAIIFDSLRQTLPENRDFKLVALSALIDAASQCSASPGHTAQPFQPSGRSSQYIIDAWKKDVFNYVEKSISDISRRYSKVVGESVVGDYSLTIDKIGEGDLVFADPPYSGVHYSRFYHVLETLALGREFSVSGKGRYPDRKFRPASAFSMKSRSFGAAERFLKICAARRLNVILTFPEHRTSNGLSAKDFIQIGKRYFHNLEYEIFESGFSTLGGNSINRAPRINGKEIILIFRV